MKKFKITIVYFQEGTSYRAEEERESTNSFLAEYAAFKDFRAERSYDWIANIECEEVNSVSQ